MAQNNPATIKEAVKGQSIKLVQMRGFWIVVLALIFLGIIIYVTVKLSKKGKMFVLPGNVAGTGVSIPAGWDPNQDARALYAAIKSDWYNPFSYGTDTDTVFSILENKTPDQLALIYNAFTSLYNEDLYQWLEDDLSSDEYKRAMELFRPVTSTQIGNPAAQESNFYLSKRQKQILFAVVIILLLSAAGYLYYKRTKSAK